MTKDEWIQQAKALFFDLSFCVEHETIKKEMSDLVEVAGGYDCMTEHCESKLRWPDESKG